VIWAIALIGIAAVVASLWRRQWVDAALVAIAAVALALLGSRLVLPAMPGGALDVDASSTPAAVAAARSVRVTGDGLRAAQWRDLPARPLVWDTPATPVLDLAFPRQIARGRVFNLTVRGSAATSGRLQLLAENGQVLAEARGQKDLGVQWVPPVAERLVLSARLLGEGGKVIAQGPVPVNVVEPAALRVHGRFGAPSFDLRALDELLARSGALMDWQVTLGKAITRTEAAREPIGDPDLFVIDAAWFEHAAAGERQALMAKVAQGKRLLVLASNANDPSAWSRTMQLDLRAQPDNARTSLDLAVAPFNPAASKAGEWSSREGSFLWTRRWQLGRIGWLGAGGWHRRAITDPQGLALWWQSVLDELGVERMQDVEWIDPEEMPLPGQRLELCARGVRGDVEIPELGQRLAWQARPDRADASCVAVWPQRPGWLTLRTQGSQPEQGSVYVFAETDWPLWQSAQRRHATRLYAARTPAAASGSAPRQVPRWPLALLFALALLALWWRERR
jgi:hypothetical protein